MPVDGVYQLPIGTEWRSRLEAVGIMPESFLAQKAGEPSPEEEKELMAKRHYFMGWYYVELEQWGRAIEQFSEALSFDPENSAIMLDLARSRISVNEMDEAEKLITKVLDKETTNVQAYMLQAQAYVIKSEAAPASEARQLLDKAAKVLEKAREIQPKNMDVLQGISKVYIQQQDVDKVIAIHREIVKNNPRDTYSLLVLGQLLSRVDKLEEAADYYQKVIDQRPGYMGGYIYLGQLYERMKKYPEAVDLYKQALLVEPRSNELQKRFELVLGQVHGRSNTRRILQEYNKFADEYPFNTEIRRMYAERLLAAENLKDATAQFEKILDVDAENTDALMTLGKIYTEEKDYEKAGEFLSRAVAINPDRIDLYDSIATTFVIRGENEEAISLYRRAIVANPNAEKLYISLAALLENDKQTTASIEVMEQAVDKVGEKPELLAVLGKLYRAAGNDEKAEVTLKKAYDEQPDNLPLYGELMNFYIEKNDMEAAASITSKTVETSSVKKDVALSVAGELYFGGERYDKALELYEQALLASPTSLDYLARLVGIANRQKLYDQGLEYVNRYGSGIKDQDKVKQIEAETYMAARRYDEAIAIYQALLDENPLEMSSYQHLIDALNDAGEYDRSLKVVEQARQKFEKSDPEQVLLMTGMVYYKQRKYDQAVKTFENLIKETGGNNDDAFYFLGSVYLDKENFEAAEKQFRKAIEINPNSSNALNALGYMFADRGIKLEEAKDLITQALSINPLAPHILDSMGWVLFKTGDIEGAEDYIQRASRFYEDPEILDHLGDIYVKQGKSELAREAYERVLELEPDKKDVRAKLEKLTGNGAK